MQFLKSHPVISTVIGIPLLLIIYGGFLWSLPIHGYVLEQGTRKPVAGAVVLVQWQGDWLRPVEPSTGCFHVETATTDAKGRYHMSAWVAPWQADNLRVFSQERYPVAIYKRGYAGFRFDDSSTRDALLKPFNGTHEERMNYLGHLMTEYCHGGIDRDRKTLRVFNVAIYQEAKVIALSSDKDRDHLCGMRASIKFAMQRPEEPAMPPNCNGNDESNP